MRSGEAENEERFKRLVADLFDWVWEVDERFLITSCSESVRALLGRTAEDTVGSSFLGLVAPDDRPRVEAEVSEILSKRTSFRDFEAWCVSASGERVDLLSCGVPILDAQGTLRGFHGFTRDVTAKKRADDALLLMRERFALATQVAGIGIWDWDLRSNLTTWDDQMFEIYGLPKRVPMPYRNWSSRVLPDHLAAAEASLQRARTSKGQDEVVFRITRGDGAERVIKSVERAVIGADGEANRLVGVNIDITEQANAEAALRESEARHRALFEGATLAIFQSTPAGRGVAVNAAFAEMFGYASPADFLASVHDVSEIFADPTRRAALIRNHLGVRGTVTVENLYRRKDGTVFTGLLRAWTFRDASGGVRLIEGFIEDITERKSAEEALRQRTAQLEALREVSLGIAAELDLDGLLRTITERAVSLLGGNGGELFLYRPERDDLELTVNVEAGEIEVSSVLGRGEGLAGSVWEAGTSVVLDREATSSAVVDGREPRSWGSAVGAPVRWGNLFLGVLGVLAAKPGRFSVADGELLELFATQAAVAIVNARLFAEVEQLAVVDELTRLFNRRGLLTLGAREVERARRFRHPLAALFIDLDEFKQLNDHYSHQAGDAVLREVSARIAAGVRETDIAARVGGEEFVVLLVETDLAAARDVAERLREAVEGITVATEQGPARVTVSIGVVAARADEADLDALVHHADAAMYAAKLAGRNRVVVRED